MDLLTTKEAAAQLGVSERRVRGLIAEGKLVAQRIGRDYAIERRALAKVKVYGKQGRPPKANTNPRTRRPNSRRD
ncbi:MAG TPA: helix-turn-helix domain-containing protein [Blastocatellia bacterium]|nr:helix-turn-helix domain-containing protein [Blastocatellia bacterium]